MDLLKKADQTFRVVLRADDKINGSTQTEPEFNIKNNHQVQYKFYNKCIMKIDSIDVSTENGGLRVASLLKKLITLSYNGSQINSFDSKDNDMTSVVSIINTPKGAEDINSNTKITYFASEITNIFGPVRFKFSETIPDNTDYIIAYTLYFYHQRWLLLIIL